MSDAEWRDHPAWTLLMVFISIFYAQPSDERPEMSFGMVSQAGSSTWMCCGAARTRGPNRVKQRSSRVINFNGQVDAGAK
jgi:hypothetical protein